MTTKKILFQGVLMAALVFVASFTHADIFNIYHDSGIPDRTVLWVWHGGGGSFNSVSSQESPERVIYFDTYSQNWAGWGVFFNDGADYTLDLSKYSQGDLKFYVKTPSNVKVEIRETGPSGPVYRKYISNYGWNGRNEWQEITIPIKDFGANLTRIYAPFMITVESSARFEVDYVRWTVPIVGYTPTPVAVNGRQLLVNSKEFTIKGVSAEFTPVGKYGPAYDWSVYPENYTRDVPLIQQMGANAIRTYDERPTQKAMLDSFYNAGIYVIMGFPVDAVYGNGQIVDFGNSVVRQNIQKRFLDMVSHWRTHPGILMWCIGNEVNKTLEDLGVRPDDWYSLVEECALAAHQNEGANYHPVTTANADQVAWDIGNPIKGADDASLPSLDVWSLQLYRGPTFGGTFADYKPLSSKPLLISEFGCDVWDGRAGEENEDIQANYLNSQWADIKSNLSEVNPSLVSIGGILFSWRDGWWKSQHGTAATHDTQTDLINYAYEDYNINEEWWGVVGISANPSERIIRSGYSNVWDSITITYPGEGQIVPTPTPTITWTTTGMEPGENIRLLITHSALMTAKPILGKIFELFKIQEAEAAQGEGGPLLPPKAIEMLKPLYVIDLDVTVPNTGSYTVAPGILTSDIRYTLTLSQEADPAVKDLVHFWVR